MSFQTSVFYTAPSTTLNYQVGAPYFSHDGILYNIPYRQPVSTGFVYGEGNQNVLGEQKLVFDTRPETMPVAGMLPVNGGFPSINPHSEENRFSREDYTLRLTHQ